MRQVSRKEDHPRAGREQACDIEERVQADFGGVEVQDMNRKGVLERRCIMVYLGELDE